MTKLQSRFVESVSLQTQHTEVSAMEDDAMYAIAMNESQFRSVVVDRRRMDPLGRNHYL